MYTISYHVEVREDVAQLSKAPRARIKKAIEEKLQVSPEIFGKPLRHSLKGFRSLRVGEYRVVFLLKKTEVLVLLIAHRKDVYARVEKRGKE
jgi:mRNA interferase RelE/StbE